jgi:hypothetical protein
VTRITHYPDPADAEYVAASVFHQCDLIHRQAPSSVSVQVGERPVKATRAVRFGEKEMLPLPIARLACRTVGRSAYCSLLQYSVLWLAAAGDVRAWRSQRDASTAPSLTFTQSCLGAKHYRVEAVHSAARVEENALFLSLANSFGSRGEKHRAHGQVIQNHYHEKRYGPQEHQLVTEATGTSVLRSDRRTRL